MKNVGIDFGCYILSHLLVFSYRHTESENNYEIVDSNISMKNIETTTVVKL